MLFCCSSVHHVYWYCSAVQPFLPGCSWSCSLLQVDSACLLQSPKLQVYTVTPTLPNPQSPPCYTPWYIQVLGLLYSVVLGCSTAFCQTAAQCFPLSVDNKNAICSLIPWNKPANKKHHHHFLLELLSFCTSSCRHLLCPLWPAWHCLAMYPCVGSRVTGTSHQGEPTLEASRGPDKHKVTCAAVKPQLNLAGVCLVPGSDPGSEHSPFYLYLAPKPHRNGR